MNKDEFYLSFENRFRGTREQILNSLSSYDGSLNYCLKNFDNPKVLDIGSGRGEWLQKLEEFGLKGIGIELNQKMVQSCRDLKLDVLHGDAISLMNNFPDHTFSMISIFHVVEHLNIDYLNMLLAECRRLISPKGLLIVETPSIDNLLISTNRFYLDSTRITYINGDYMTFQLENIGFKSSIPYFINPGPLCNADDMNLTRVLNGISQDLCIISSLSDFLNNPLNINKLLIEDSLNIGMNTLNAASEFDHALNILRNKIFDQNLQIFELRRTLIDLQKNSQELQNTFIKLRNNFFFKFASYLFKILKKIKKLFILILRNTTQIIFRFSKKTTPLMFINLAKKNQILIPIFFLLLERLGMKGLNYKFMTIFSKTNSYSNDSIKINERLLKRYSNSSNSRKIYKQLKNL